MKDPIAIARELLASEWRIAWPAPLVRSLRERSFDLALDWVFRITPDLLPRTGSPHATRLLVELEMLRQWRTASPPSGVFRQKAEDLWYCGNRDVAATAMSHLCMEVAQVVCPDLEIGINWLWDVPSLLCDDNFRGWPRMVLVESCLSDFQELFAEIARQPSDMALDDR